MNNSTKKRVIGLKDIAREAGLAVPTVSLILNGRTNTFISAATRERVKEIAHRLNYRPKFSHKLIHGRETHTAAIIITEEVHRTEEHIKSLVLLLIEKLERTGFSSYITTLTGNAEERVNDLIDRGCDAFIVIGIVENASALQKMFTEHGVHYIGYNSTLDRNVISDTPAAVERMLRHFIDAGRDLRMLLHTERDAYAPNSRFAGLVRVFPDIPHDTLRERYVFPLLCAGATDPFTIGYETTRSLMNAAPNVNAIFYFTDTYALGGVKWLTENGFTVGRDVLVAGFNNTEAARYHSFPISSGDQIIEAVAESLAGQLFSDEGCSVMVEPKVYIR